MIEKKKINKSGILFLSGCFFYVTYLMFFFHFDNEIFELSSVDNYGSCLIDSVERVEDFDFDNFEINESFEEGEEFEDIDLEVLGSSTVRCPYRRIVERGRCEYVTEVKEQLFCGGGYHHPIIRRTIFAPAYMFTGAEAPFDNLVQVNNPARRVAYRNASELIDPENDYYITQPPLNHFRDKVLGDNIKKNPFQMDWGFAPSQPLVDHPRRIEFDSDGMSICPSVVNDGKFNVTPTNVLEEDMVVSFIPPNSMELPQRKYTGGICGSDRVRWLDLCDLFWLSQKPPLCTLPAGCPPWGCESRPFWVDAVLGSGEKCHVGECGVRYWEAARILTAPPSRARNLYPVWLNANQIENDFIVDDPVIITSPCFAILGGYYAGPCLWDLSTWQHVYSMEQIFTYPGYYGTMSEDEYWLGVADEIGAVVEIKGFRDIELDDRFPAPPELAVRVTVNGSGSIVGSEGISCSGSCSYSIPQGTEITIKAIPQDGSSFEGWLVPQACRNQSEQCRVTVNYEPFNIIAAFN